MASATEEAQTSLDNALNIFNASDSHLNLLVFAPDGEEHRFSQRLSNSSICFESMDVSMDEWVMKSSSDDQLPKMDTRMSTSSLLNQIKKIQEEDTEFQSASGALRRFQHLESLKIAPFESVSAASIRHSDLDFIHCQGLLPPICTFQVMHANKHEREYYRMLLPPLHCNQRVVMLCCRKKKNQEKYRFSLDAEIMTKKDNPCYVGKMKVIRSVFNKFRKQPQRQQGVKYLVTLHDDRKLCTITISNKNEIEVQIFANTLHSKNPRELQMQGTINQFIENRLTLMLKNNEDSHLSERTVLEIKDSTDPRYKSNQITSVQMVDFDYPLSVFLSFVITSSVHCRNRYL